jgi:hypothetical protein
MQAYVKNGMVDKGKMDKDVLNIKTFQEYLDRVMALAERKKWISPLFEKKKKEKKFETVEEEKKASEEVLARIN